MLQFVLASPNVAFAVALGVMLVIAVVEIAGMFFGTSLTSAVDDLLPDLDADMDIAVDADADLALDADGAADAGGGVLAGLLSWLCFGRVPALILAIVFLCTFGLAGLTIQSIVQETAGRLLPGWFAVVPALAVALPAMRVIGLALARWFPKEETYAVSRASFLGRTATITIGTAAAGQPAEAKLTDKHGRAHYVRVEPADPDQQFPTGAEVTLARRVKNVFRVVAAKDAAG